jgi:hypothetical protein
LDKLVLEIETNGAVSAEDAVRACQDFCEQLAVSQLIGNGSWLRLTHQFSAARNSSIRFCCAGR